ncbi:hypothetical protein PENSOL_c164G02820, partial [Penicillium solitum]
QNHTTMHEGAVSFRTVPAFVAGRCLVATQLPNNRAERHARPGGTIGGGAVWSPVHN